ncbi:MAG: AI-2E family transporter [Patescibacteria group bacterium]|nr:AI-2E family transporter [Patescibacteria group bacterium]
MSKQNISISTDTILRVILILVIILFVYLIKDVLALFFVAIVLASAFDPLIDRLQKKRIPRSLSIILVYLVFLSLVGGAIYMMTGPIITQVRDMSRAFPEFYQKINQALIYLQNIEAESGAKEAIGANFSDITKGLSQLGSGIFKTLTTVFGGVISFFVVLVITFYLTVQEEAMKRFVSGIIPIKRRPYVMGLIDEMQHRMGYWLRGQMFLSLMVFTLTYIGLSILGVKYALLLALLAGIFEIVPFIGPWISAIPGVFFAFSQSPGKAVAVAIMYFIVQQIESNLLTPKVMGKSTGLNPLVVLLAVLIGARLGGILGALLAIPMTLVIVVYVESVINQKKENNAKVAK